MEDIDKIIAEAVEQLYPNVKLPPKSYAFEIVKAVCEKAYDIGYDRGFDKGYLADESRPTNDTTKKVIDLAYRVICEHSGECEIENLPNEMQCIADGAAQGNECDHLYSRSMDQPYPRHCIKCNEVEAHKIKAEDTPA